MFKFFKYEKKVGVIKMKIRKATIKDAKGIANVHVDSWRTTYKGIIPQNFLDKLSYDKRADLWRTNISNVNNYVLVAENDIGGIIGFTDGSTRETNLEPHSSDLTSIYLLEEYQGMGIGKQLLKEMFISFKQKNYKKIFVDVLAENKTRFFYEYYGAEYVKTVQINIDGKLIDEIVYVWNDLDKVLEKFK